MRRRRPVPAPVSLTAEELDLYVLHHLIERMGLQPWGPAVAAERLGELISTIRRNGFALLNPRQVA